MNRGEAAAIWGTGSISQQVQTEMIYLCEKRRMKMLHTCPKLITEARAEGEVRLSQK